MLTDGGRKLPHRFARPRSQKQSLPFAQKRPVSFFFGDFAMVSIYARPDWESSHRLRLYLIRGK